MTPPEATQPATPAVRKLPILSWWWVGLAAALTVAGTSTFMWVLLQNVAVQTDPRVASANLDAIRTALSLAVGAGGALALWLAARRQRTTELQLVETSRIAAENKSHLERVATSTEFDLRERRITDLYGKAVEQLGSEKAPVRLGGLYALERMAQEYPGHRQTVVNVVCAYLKMPFTVPRNDLRSASSFRAPASQEDLLNLAELNARTAAQDILIRNLRVTGSPNDRGQWKGIDLDLGGAVLVDFRLEDCIVRNADFHHTRFVDVARFDNTRFEEDVWFFHTKFDEANAYFYNARFERQAVFTGVDFGLHARFDKVTFAGPAGFYYATFRSLSSFVEARFESAFSFDECRLEEIDSENIVKDSFGPARFDFTDTTARAAGSNVELVPPAHWKLTDPDSDGLRRFAHAPELPSGEAADSAGGPQPSAARSAPAAETEGLGSPASPAEGAEPQHDDRPGVPKD